MKSIASMLFVLAAALFLSGPAQAGYTDGMNQYAGYHVMHGGVDPTGLWVVHRQSDRKKAAATTKGGETLRELADYIGLDPDEYKEWLSHWDNTEPPPGLDEVLGSNQGKGCARFEVPNEMLVVWIGNFWDVQVSSINKQAQALRSEGFKIQQVISPGASLDFCAGSVFCRKRDSHNAQEFLDKVSKKSGDKSLHGILIDGHGRAGHVWNSAHTWKVDYQEIKNSQSYGLGAVLLNVCNGGWCAKDNPQQGGLYDDGWLNGELYGPPWTYGNPGDPPQITAGGRDLVSSNGIFSGLRTGLTPPIDNIDVSELFPGDTQGTK